MSDDFAFFGLLTGTAIMIVILALVLGTPAPL